MTDVKNPSVEEKSLHRWHDKFPETGTGPIDASTCSSPEYFELERKHIFEKVWWKVGRVEEIPKPGDFKVKKIYWANTSIILVRGKDDQIRAFYNVCEHRGNTVISEIPGQHEFYGRARGHAMTCRFHGWVYSTKGELLHIPAKEKFFDSFEEVAKEEGHGLVPLPCETWEGFIFINFMEKPLWDLETFLGGYGKFLSGYAYGAATRQFKYYTMLDANWKVCLDAFQEGYHVDTIHAGSFPCDWCGIENIQLFGPHRTSSITFNMDSISLGPVQAMSFQKSNSSIVDASRGRTMLPKQFNPDDDPAWAFELGTIFPCFMPHPAEGFYFTHQFWPVAHNKCLWEGTQYMVTPEKNSERWSMEYSQVLQRNAWLEDTQTMEDTHRAIESGRRKYLHLQDDEILIQHGYKVVQDWIDGKIELG